MSDIKKLSIDVDAYVGTPTSSTTVTPKEVGSQSPAASSSSLDKISAIKGAQGQVFGNERELEAYYEPIPEYVSDLCILLVLCFIIVPGSLAV